MMRANKKSESEINRILQTYRNIYRHRRIDSFCMNSMHFQRSGKLSYCCIISKDTQPEKLPRLPACQRMP